MLGEITSAFGIKGEVRIKTFTKKPADIASYGPLRDITGEHLFKIESFRVTPKGVIAHFLGIDDRTSAKKLQTIKLFIQRSQLPPAETGSYYEEDLIGLEAFAEDGTTLGHVTGLLNFGAGNLLEITSPQKKDTTLIPFKDTYVPKVDLLNGKIVIKSIQFIEDVDDHSN